MTGLYKTKYELLKAELISRIEAGIYQVGGRFPSQNQLMRSEKVSYSTVSRVLLELQEAGYINRIKGKGSFVTEPENTGIGADKAFKIKFIISQEFKHYMSGEVSWLNNFEITSSIIHEAAKGGIDIERIYFSDNSSLPDDIAEEHSCVFLLNYFGYNKTVIDSLQTRDIPFVIHGPMTSMNYNYNAVVANVWQGAFDITTRFLEAGRDDVLFLVPPVQDAWFLPKLDGYKGAYQRFQNAVSNENIVTCSDKPESAYQCIRDYVKNNRKALPKAILAFNDEIAVVVLNVLKEFGVSVPDDVAVAGFDDNPECRNNDIPLTTVKYPCDQIGIASVQMMLLLNEQPFLAPIVKSVPTEIIYRESFKDNE